MKKGKVHVMVGPMFAGKTSEIQSIVRRFESIGQRVLVLTANIDNRYQVGNSVTAIVNHDRAAIPAIAVGIRDLLTATALPAFMEAHAIVVDEGQFFVDCLIPFVVAAAEVHGKHVVVVGLDSDAERNPFGDMLALVAKADSVEKKTALCRRCADGTEAIFTRSVGSREGQVAVGGADMYEPVCREHYLV